MKKCTVCKEEKELSEFHVRSTARDGLASQCKSCKNGMDKSYYSRNPEKFRSRNDEARRSNAQKLFEYLAEHPCVDCPEDDVLVLEFDHRDGSKLNNVTTLLATSWAAVLREIERCDVRCSNCHTRITHQRANTQRWQYVNTQRSVGRPATL